MTTDQRTNKLRILRKLLLPVVGWGLRHGILLHDFVAVLKEALVFVSKEELQKSGADVNASRVSVMTGLYREEIKRIFNMDDFAAPPIKNVAGRVLVTWEQSKRLRTAKNKPKDLETEGLHEVIRSITQALNPATVVFELERSGAIKHVKGKWRLVRSTQVLSKSEEMSYNQVGDDIASVLIAAEENIKLESGVGNLHHRTVFDNVYRDALPEIREWLLREGREFHRRARAYLAERDADLGEPRSRGTPAGCSVVLGSFSHCNCPESSE